MKLIQQWRAYRGSVDERIEVEMNRIYKTGFFMLMFGYVVSLFYTFALSQARAMADITTTGAETIGLDLPGVLFFVWFMIVMLYCIARQTRKGFVDDGRFAEVDEFPGGYFALLSGLAALGVGVLVAVVTVAARLQVGVLDYLALIVAMESVSLAVLVFGLCMLAFYLLFRGAKKARNKVAGVLDED